MNQHFHHNIQPLRSGLLFALATLLYGFGLGGVFGAFEDNIKQHLKTSASAVAETVYENDTAKRKKVTDKAWVYFKRAHLHANGIGTTAIALTLLLAALPFNLLVKQILAIFLGLGGLGYSMFWMFAGLRAPALGSTGLAKASLSWLALPTSAMCIMGVGVILVLFVYTVAKKSTNQT